MYTAHIKGLFAIRKPLKYLHCLFFLRVLGKKLASPLSRKRAFLPFLVIESSWVDLNTFNPFDNDGYSSSYATNPFDLEEEKGNPEGWGLLSCAEIVN